MAGRVRNVAVTLCLVFGIAAPAMADHGHWRTHVGVYFGGPFWPGWYYPPYYPPVVAVPVPTSPPVYIEREPASATPPQTSYWYWCDNPQGYYPYIKNCPGGWKKVEPGPPPEQ